MNLVNYTLRKQSQDRVCHPLNKKSEEQNSILRPVFHLRPTNEIEIGDIIDSLKNKNSCGHDEVPISVIKAAKISKIAKIIPIYKKGDKKDMANYRPISYYLTYQKYMKKLYTLD